MGLKSAGTVRGSRVGNIAMSRYTLFIFIFIILPTWIILPSVTHGVQTSCHLFVTL